MPLISTLSPGLVSATTISTLSASPFISSVIFTLRPYGDSGLDSNFIMVAVPPAGHERVHAPASLAMVQGRRPMGNKKSRRPRLPLVRRLRCVSAGADPRPGDLREADLPTGPPLTLVGQPP